MNRPIKFRAWVTGLTKEPMMIYQYKPWEFSIDFKGTLIIHDYMIRESFEEDGYKLMQFTGVHDKNGKEIYDGDIFKAPHDFGPAGYHERIGLVQYDTILGYQWQYWLLDKLEIIGNIYENPELLEGANE